MITGKQIKLARVGLDLTVRDLAAFTGLNKTTITNIENGSNARASTMETIQGVLERYGVEFIPENGGGIGIRLPRDAEQPEDAGQKGGDVL